MKCPTCEGTRIYCNICRHPGGHGAKCPECGGTGEAPGPTAVTVPLALPRSLHAALAAQAAEEGVGIGRLVTTLLAVRLRDLLARPPAPTELTRNPGYYDSDLDIDDDDLSIDPETPPL